MGIPGDVNLATGNAMSLSSSICAGQSQSTPFLAPSNLLPPIVVDLDGTLIKTNLLFESFFSLLRLAPLSLFLLPCWLLKGRAHLKHEIARRTRVDVASLPYRKMLLEYLQVEQKKGRSISLATASDERLAQQVADHLKLFDSVLASDGMTNLLGENKRKRLVTHFGEKGFDYVANGRSDVAVWSSARKAIVVTQNRHLLRAVARVAEVDSIFEEPPTKLADYLNTLRPQHWLKNLLVLVPVFAAQRFSEPALIEKTLLAFAAFCCFASSGYLFNDLLDLAADRHHPKKCLRPFASGRFSLSYALTMGAALIGLGLVLAAFVSGRLVSALLLYLILTLTYSLYLKTIALLDVIVLAGLYTQRIMAGAIAIAIWPSEWLLALSTFLFLSLALAKRYGELVFLRSVTRNHIASGSYQITDTELLAAMGTSSGFIAVLVLILYITSGTATVLYARPELLWLICPLLLYWIGRVWLVAHRGKMPDDPFVFALRDQASRILIILMVSTALLAI